MIARLTPHQAFAAGVLAAIAAGLIGLAAAIIGEALADVPPILVPIGA
ncbi:MAG: hypothetical protein HY673_03960 [Chloroflexi bacterium]|nr:hypothetical protein [Chloroflexota bacterium]